MLNSAFLSSARMNSVFPTAAAHSGRTIRCSVPLSEYGNNIHKDNLDAGNTDTPGHKAIPTPNAPYHYLKEQLNLNDENSPSRTAWEGVLTVLALSKTIGWDLRFSPLVLPQTAQDFSAPVIRTLPSGDGSHLRLMLNGTPIAYFREGFGFELIAAIDNPQILRDVPWYSVSDRKWLPICPNGVPDNMLSEELLQKLSEWLYCLSHSDNCPQDIRQSLDKFRQRIDTALNALGINPIAASGNNDFVPSLPLPANAPAFLKMMNQVPSFGIPANNEFFSGSLMIVNAETLGHNALNLSFVRNDVPYSVLLPLSAAGIAYLRENPDMAIESASLDTDGFFENPQDGLKVTLVLRKNLLRVPKTYTYMPDRILYGGDSFPFFSLWPNVKILRTETNADGTQKKINCWKRYFFSMYPRDTTELAADCPLAEIRTLSGENLQYCSPDPGASATSLTSLDDHSMTKPWSVLRFQDYPEYIPLAFRCGETGPAVDIGCLYVTPENTYQYGSVDNAHMAIDFGTTNTTWKLKLGDTLLSSAKIFDPSLLSLLQTMKSNDGQNTPLSGEHHRLYWMSATNDPEIQKIRSISQIYNTASSSGMDLHAPESGRAALFDGSVLAEFETRSENKGLENIGIYTSTKFEHNNTAGGRAARVFLETLSMNSALCALIHGAKQLTFHYSFPDNASRENQTAYWNSAAKLVDACVNAPNFLQPYDCMSECEGSARFVCETYAVLTGVNVTDIGGGTTDTTFWVYDENTKTFREAASYSMHFAGNQIVCETLCNVFAKDDSTFKNLWSVIHDQKTYESLTSRSSRLACAKEKLRFLAHNFEYQRYTSELATISSAANSLLNVADLNTTLIDANMTGAAPWDARMHFTSLVRAKIAAIFYVLAQIMKQYICDEDLPRFMSTFEHYNFALAGGGAKALSLCGNSFSAFLSEMMCSELKNRYDSNGPSEDSFKIVPPSETAKEEVSRGMLNALRHAAEYRFSLSDPAERQTVMSSSLSVREALDKIHEGYFSFLPVLAAKVPGMYTDTPLFPYETDTHVRITLYDALAKLPQDAVTQAVSSIYQSMKNSRELEECPAYLLPAVGAVKTLEFLLNLFL